jgi:hypothetical protein
MPDRLLGSAGIAALTAIITAVATLGAQRLLLRAQARKTDAEADTARADAADKLVRSALLLVENMQKELSRKQDGGAA